MAILWNQSLTPWIDPNGDPYSGARAFFYDANTSSPLAVYTEYSLSIPHDHPVVADAGGKFPAIFLPEQITYRVRVETATGVTLDDVDGISSPTTVVPEAPEGDTEAQFLHQTGDIKMSWRTSAPNGWVRLNGRAIGSSASSATERANDDCEYLFEFLWNNDANLTVSGGRGATSAGDWAAAKTIALPDFRGRAPIAPDSFGNSASGRVTDGQLGADSDTKGSAGGAASHVLTADELPSHMHGAGTLIAETAGNHRHDIENVALVTGGDFSSARWTSAAGTMHTAYAGDHTHTVGGSTASAGGGAGHSSIQPSIIVPFFIKL